MGDAADILGVQKPKANTSNDPFNIMTGADKSAASLKSDKKKKPKGMSRELFNLMGKDGIAPSIQTNTDTKNAGFKNKRQSHTQGKWVWTEYHSSARSDSQPFSHWVKADLQAFDYVYAKFNTKLDPITYTSEEYESLLKVTSWTRSETDHFMSVCHEYNLRWPVIADRFEATSHRPTEELMARYYFITTRLKAHRNEKRGGNVSAQQVIPSACFDVEYERCRRRQQDMQFHLLSPEDQAEEMALRDELKSLDASIKKVKKSIKQAPPPPPQVVTTGASKATAATSSKKKHSQKDNASSAAVAPATAASIAAATVGGSVAAAVLLKAMPPIVMYGSGVMAPALGQPCLQSARLAFTSDLPDFSKKSITGFEGTSSLDLSEPFVAKIKHFSQELGMPDKLLPTRSVCDLNDQIRRDMATLLALQSKVTSNEEKISAIREHNPHINSAAYGNMFGAKGAPSGSSHGAPVCRLAIPDTTFLLNKDSDSSGGSGSSSGAGAGHGLPACVLKPYVPAAPHLLVPPPPVPVEKTSASGEKGDKSGGGGGGSGSAIGAGSKAGSKGSAAATASDPSAKPPKKLSKAKRKAAEMNKDAVASPTSSSKQATQSFVLPEPKAPKAKAAAAPKAPPAVKKINPVLVKAATIPILPLNNTPESIAIAAISNAAKAKAASELLAAEQRAAAAGGVMSAAAKTVAAIVSTTPAAALSGSTLPASSLPASSSTSSSAAGPTPTPTPKSDPPAATPRPFSSSSTSSVSQSSVSVTATQAASTASVTATASAIATASALMGPAAGTGTSSQKRGAEDHALKEDSSEPSAKKAKTS